MKHDRLMGAVSCPSLQSAVHPCHLYVFGSPCVNMRNIRTCLSLFLRHTLCLGAVLGSTLMAGNSLAAESHAVLHADELDLSVPCAQVHIKVDPSLKDSMALEETSGLTPVIQTTRDGTESHLRLSLHDCPKGGRLTMRLSSDTALTLHDSPQAHITISGTLTTLESNLDDASLQVDRVESLDMSISGTTQAHIHQLDRAAQINATGGARLDVDTALLSALSAQLSDNSQLSIMQGQIDSLTLSGSHQAEASIMATINNASITTNDAASVTLNKVTGSVQDGGTKHITHAAAPEAAAPAQPSPSSPTQNGPAQLPQPDGQAQGLNSPTLPHVTKPAPMPVPSAASPVPTGQTGPNTSMPTTPATHGTSMPMAAPAPGTQAPAAPAGQAPAQQTATPQVPAAPVNGPAQTAPSGLPSRAAPQTATPVTPQGQTSK